METLLTFFLQLLVLPIATCVGVIIGLVERFSGKKIEVGQMLEPAKKELTPEEKEKMAKRKRKRGHVAAEVISTEETYAYGLLFLVSEYLEPLIDPRTMKKLKLQQVHIDSLFSNVKDIADFHMGFLDALKESPDNLAPVFLQKLDRYFIDIYDEYVSTYDRCIKAVEKFRKKKRFSTWLTKRQKECGGMLIESYLIMPIQRIPRYELLFRELIKYTEKDDPRFEDIVAANDHIKNVGMDVNESKKRGEETAQIARIPSIREQSGVFDIKSEDFEKEEAKESENAEEPPKEEESGEKTAEKKKVAEEEDEEEDEGKWWGEGEGTPME